jgi:hypothetical protein
MEVRRGWCPLDGVRTARAWARGGFAGWKRSRSQMNVHTHPKTMEYLVCVCEREIIRNSTPLRGVQGVSW